MEKEVKIYSHSRLWLYENCPESYKIKYIDKKFPDLPKSVELFLGGMVHESLEWLYKRIKEGYSPELDELIRDFAERWKSGFTEDIRINNSDEHFYFNRGIKFLIDYFQKNKPFDENTIDIEKRIVFPLDEEGEYRIQGYVDRIVFNIRENEYEVHDYKTNNFLKGQEALDSDRQLAFYHLGVQETFGVQAKIKLIWHFLAHNRTMVSRRTQEQLDELKKKTLELIKKIEDTASWSACGKRWCDWCSYKKTNGLGNY